MVRIAGHVIFGSDRFNVRVRRPPYSLRSLPEDAMRSVDSYIELAKHELTRLTTGPTKEDRYRRNRIVYGPDWLTPTIAGPAVPFDAPNSEYQYYLRILNLLKNIRQRGYVTREDDAFLFQVGAPPELLLNPDLLNYFTCVV